MYFSTSSNSACVRSEVSRLSLIHIYVAYIAPPLTVRQKQRSKRVEGFLKEFQKAGLGDHVVIKAADEQIDKDVPGIDSEYRCV